MRLTEFHRLVHSEFGDARGDAIGAGVDPREAWRALCEEFDVPEERRLGPDE